MPQLEVREEPESSRYVAVLGDEQVGLADYTVDGQTVTFTHTEVAPAHQHQGIGAALIETSLDDVRRRGQHVVPQCPFYAAWFEQHPDAADLLARAVPERAKGRRRRACPEPSLSLRRDDDKGLAD